METHALLVLLASFWEELRNFKQFFCINDFAENLLFKAVLPVNDILSDFLVADNLYNTDNPNTMFGEITPTQFCAMIMYFFIASPGFMLLIYNCGLYLEKFCFHGINLLVLVVIVVLVPLLLSLYADPRVVFYMALVISCCFQLVNFMAVVFHGPYMEKLVGEITYLEGKFESAPQLFVHLALLYAGDAYMEIPATERFYGLVTSVLMMSKDFAENILLNTKDIQFSKLPFGKKLFL